MNVPAFDPVLDRVSAVPVSFTETEALAELWSHGEDGWLREDPRFRPTPWGRWIPADRYLINDLLVRALREGHSELSLADQLAALSKVVGCPTAFCPADPRLRVHDDRVRLAPSELSGEPLLEDVGPLLQYVTHLPVLTLKAAAASRPAGEWGPAAEAQQVEVQGWLRVEQRNPNRRMFVAQVRGSSMDGGKAPMEDGDWVLFEFTFCQGTTYDHRGRPVLVRWGAPIEELGSYAVKKIEESPDRVVLVSSNPDTERFPDIVIPPEEADSLRIIATVLRVLKLADFARRPKPQRKPGRRMLEGGAGLVEQGARLDRSIVAFFEGKPSPDEEPEAQSDGWQTRVVCLAADAGGPHLEVGPLDGLPPFVGKLHVLGEGWDGLLLAANAQRRPGRLPVRPGSGPWRWEALGFEDEEDLGLDRLACDALPLDVVTVFRVDAGGVGRRQVGTTLSEGQVYRLLLPPGLADETMGVDLGGGWRLWGLDLAMPPSASLQATLQALGLGVGETWPRLEWALLPPTSWRTNPRGDAYPAFGVADEITIQAQGLPGEHDEAAVLFLRGPGGTERLSLPHAASALVSLGALTPGRWAAALLHPRTEVRATTLLFEVAEGATRHVSAGWSVTLPETREGEDPVEAYKTLEMTAPPGWPVSLAWRTLGEVPLATVHADESSVIDLGKALPLVIERARRVRVADLVVDLGELGRKELAHDRHPKPEQIGEKLTGLWAQREGLVRSRSGAWLTLVPSWFRPVTELLGYAMEPLPENALPDADHGLAAWRLVVGERSEGRIGRNAVRVLVLTTDVELVINQNLEWIDRACAAAGVRDAIVTDGVLWTTHRRGGRTPRTMWSLALVQADLQLEAMVVALAEGV